MHFTKYKSLAFAFIIALTANSIFAQNESAGVERYGLYIGSNDGGKSHQRLLYAGSDAISFQKIMTDIGGISKSNGILLLDPTKEDVDNAFEIISDMMQKKKMEAKRSEFVFYYSGHSDENSLLLGKTSYDYSSLKAAISNVPSDVHVVILDSCFSGNFIRTKGGQKQKPFLIDDSSVVKGHAYLSSSSSQESSQESDEIGSSFFTNAMITGLRGAADTSGDKKVTLNELYSYAFNETLSKTENTADPQHPNYNITLVGSGDLVLSDVSSSDCILTISRELTGRVIVRDKNGKLVSEINKITQTPIYLALEEGSYGVTVIGEHSTLQGSFVLGPQKNYALSTSSLSQIARVENRTRGDETGEETKEEPQEIPTEESGIIDKPFVFSFVCNEFENGQNEKTESIISLALLRSRLFKVEGAMISGVGNEAQIANGIQAAYVYNMADEMAGVQWSNIFNYSGSLTGVQSSGILNIATGDVYGLQGTGIVNISSGEFKGVQAAGIVNTAANNFKGLQAAGILNLSKGEFVGLQGAGIVNAAAGNFTGLQGAGIVNVNVGDYKGLQAAPFVNVATGNVKGVQ
ncbi:MAG: caspase family protein, partial [Treponema sp.]|nr:caspase family protein [Treponema sp.]